MTSVHAYKTLTEGKQNKIITRESRKNDSKKERSLFNKMYEIDYLPILRISFAWRLLKPCQQNHSVPILQSWHSTRPHFFEAFCRTVHVHCPCFHFLYARAVATTTSDKFFDDLWFDGCPYTARKLSFGTGCDDAGKGCRDWLHTCQLHLLESNCLYQKCKEVMKKCEEMWKSASYAFSYPHLLFPALPHNGRIWIHLHIAVTCLGLGFQIVVNWFILV